MRLRIIFLLTVSFFVNAVTGFSMTRGSWKLKEQSTGQYGSFEMGEKREREGRALSDPLSTSRRKNVRDSGISTAIDRSIVAEKEELTIDSSAEMLTRKIQEAEAIALKWKTLMEEKEGARFREEEIMPILKEVTDDLEYWVAQKKKILSWVGTDSSEELKETEEPDLKHRELLLQLSAAASEGIGRAQMVAEFYLAANQGSQHFLSGRGDQLFKDSHPVYTGDAAAMRKFLNELASADVVAMNPLNGASDHIHQQGPGIKGGAMKLPSLREPLISTDLNDILETWPDHAEIRYNKNSGEYKSYCSQPTSFFEIVRLMAGRSRSQRDQHRDAIEKIAQTLGTDRATSFNNNWSVRFNKILGNPLTPKFIKSMERDIAEGQSEKRVRTSLTSQGRDQITSLVQRMAELWQQLSRGNRSHGYSEIVGNAADK